MRAELPRLKVGNYRVFFTRLGYHPASNGSYEHRLNRDSLFPRFHLYIEEHGDVLAINLHLDAKAPSYAGTSAHAGEYDGELVEREIARIVGSIA